MNPQIYNNSGAGLPTNQQDSGSSQAMGSSFDQQSSGLQPAIHQPPPQSGDSSAVPMPSTSPIAAEDSDLIETEWVNAAKRIIQTYATDPFNQNRAMSLLRADYLKKRYNKDVKLPEN